MEHEDPYHRQAPWPPRLKVKVAMSRGASDRWLYMRNRSTVVTVVGRIPSPRHSLLVWSVTRATTVGLYNKPWDKCFTQFLIIVVVFSQTWLRYVWLMAWQIRLSACRLSCLSSVRLWHAYTLLRRFNFSGIFLHHIVVVWLSGNSSTKNHEDRPRGSPQTGALNARE